MDASIKQTTILLLRYCHESEISQRRTQKYGFFYLERQIPERQARQFLTVKKLTQRENLVFIPKKKSVLNEFFLNTPVFILKD